MNPLLQEALGSILRWALTLLTPTIVSLGIWTPEDATKYVAAVSLALLALGWSIYQKRSSRLVKLVALSSDEKLTEDQAKARVKAGMAPSVTTSPHEVPKKPTDA